MIAGLSRALARTCAAEALRGNELQEIRPEILRAAKWRAARFGPEEDLVDVRAGRAIRAPDLVEDFLAYLRPSLEEYDEWDEVEAQVHEVLDRGTGAARQREAYTRGGRFEDVVDFIVGETRKGTA